MRKLNDIRFTVPGEKVAAMRYSRSTAKCLVLIGGIVALGDFSCWCSPASAEHQTLEFAGRTWNIKHSTGIVGPGTNIFSENPSDVWSDATGLHLTIQKTGPTWFSTEVLLNENLGYGTYMFQTDSRQDILNANATFGAFTFDTNSTSPIPGDPNREIDFEDSRFGNPAEPTTSQVVVQPFSVAGNLARYTLPDLSVDSKLTRFFSWSPGKVEFTTLKGHHSPFNFSPADVIHQYTYLDDGVTHLVPIPDREVFHLNLWLNNTNGYLNGPLGGQPVEVLVNDFQFFPLPPMDDAVLFDFETGSQGWFSFGDVGTSSGQLPTGGSEGQGRFHLGDFDFPDDSSFGMGEISPPGQDLSAYVGLSVDALFKDVVGQAPYVGVKELEIQIETPAGEEFIRTVTMTDTYQKFIVAFEDFQSKTDFLAPSATDLSDVAIKLIMRNENGTGFGELNYDQIIGLGSINNADFDADLGVDGNDFLIWQRGFGTGSLHSEGDANNSQTVDADDFSLWENQFGLPAESPLPSTLIVPEPSSMLLFFMAMLSRAAIRRLPS